MNNDEFEITVTHQITGIEDGDYTDDFIAAGTTMSVHGPIKSDPIPIERAIVKSGRLFLTGYATFTE